MFIQLGNHTFDKAFTPDSISHSDESSFAEHALINIKPRLQPTGNNLEEINLTIRLRSEIANVERNYKALKQSKDEWEILPYLLGTGEYKGDYVITKIETSPLFTLPDGFTVEMQMAITLKEYQVADKLQQQQNAARKAAFAVGNVRPVRITPDQLRTPAQTGIKSLGTAYSNAAVIDDKVRNYQNNISQRVTLVNKIKGSITKMNKALDDAKEKFDALSDKYDVQELIGRINLAKEAADNFTLPPNNLDELINQNRELQSSIRAVKTSSIPMVNLVVSRTI